MAKAQKLGFQPGQSGNPEGRPKTGGAGTGKPISRLRSTLNKLKELEPDAIAAIQKALNGDTTIDKAQVDTAKWIVTSIASLTRTAIAEETYKIDLRKEQNIGEEGGDKPASNVTPISRFSTTLVQEED